MAEAAIVTESNSAASSSETDPLSNLVSITESMYPDRLSVMRQQGDYAFIIRLKLSEDVTAQFCISGK